MSKPRQYHISNSEMRQLQDLAHMLWLGSGALITYDPYKDKRDKPKKRRALTKEEKEIFFRMNHVDNVPILTIAKIFHLCKESVAKSIREIKRKKGIPILKNGKYH